jgi:hypothetical protein
VAGANAPALWEQFMVDPPRVIRTLEEYRSALREMDRLQCAPLGTPETEGLQDLIEAILDYEGRHVRDGASLH